MLMTEQEAKGKWCPFARAIDWQEFRDGEKPVTTNRHNTAGSVPHTNCFCLASGCAVWEWEKVKGYEGDPWHGLGMEGWMNAPESVLEKFRAEERDRPTPTKGSCGLATRH